MHILSKKRPKVNNITLHHKDLEKEEQTKPNTRRRKEIIKIKLETNIMENRKQQRNQSWFFEKIDKIYKPLVRLPN